MTTAPPAPRSAYAAGRRTREAIRLGDDMRRIFEVVRNLRHIERVTILVDRDTWHRIDTARAAGDSDWVHHLALNASAEVTVYGKPCRYLSEYPPGQIVVEVRA